jgi:23S rRNA (cytosine1962-C5)-methyltransferase
VEKESPRIYADAPENYELIDAGGGQKLERWGEIITIRPERQAYFKSEIPFGDWEKQAHWKFIEKSGQKGVWKNLNSASKEWTFSRKVLNFKLELTQFKHLGLFPEQNINWQFIEQNLHPKQRFLNLFAYTGASSLIARSKGAEVFHVDSVKQLLGWAKSNMESSNQTDIKWVLEDALKFAKREAKRGNKYYMIQMDPPAWGLGAKGEKWKLEDKIEELIRTAHEILEPKGWLILNTYSPSLKLAQTRSLVKQIFRTEPETAAELWMKTSSGKDMYFGDLVRVRK